MSVQATSWVWEHSASKGNNRLVLLAVADAANREGAESCQAVETVARMTGVNVRTVQRSLRALTDAGELTPTGRHPRYRTTIYALPMVAGTPPSVAAVKPVTASVVGDTQSLVGDTWGTSWVTPGADVGDTAVSPYPSTTPERNPNNTLPAASATATMAADATRLVMEGKGPYLVEPAKVHAVMKRLAASAPGDTAEQAAAAYLALRRRGINSPNAERLHDVITGAVAEQAPAGGVQSRLNALKALHARQVAASSGQGGTLAVEMVEDDPWRVE